MTFYKRNSCYWHFGFYKILCPVIHIFANYSRIIGSGHTLVLPPDLYVIMEIKCSANKNSKSYLSKNFKPASQSIFITLFVSNTLSMCNTLSSQLQIIINKTDYSKPHRSDQHEYNIYCIETGK